MNQFEITAEHQTIFDWIDSGSGHGIISATAGAGKTSTLIQVAERGHGNKLFVAFAKHNAQDLEHELPSGIKAKTLHSVGYGLTRTHLGAKVKLQDADEDKYVRIALEEGANGSSETARELKRFVRQLCKLARLNCTPVSNAHAVAALTERYGLEIPSDPSLELQACAMLASWLEIGRQRALEFGEVDFTDLLWLPVTERAQVSHRDWLYIDEAQDLSPLQVKLTQMLVAPDGGRLLYCGDEHQSIMGFAGASSGSLAHIRTETNATVMPLNTSYRCPQSHVRLANEISPQMRSATGAPEGGVYWIGEHMLPAWAKPGNLVLSRFNAALTDVLFQLLDAGVPASLKNSSAKRYLEMLEGMGDSSEQCLVDCERIEGERREKLMARKDSLRRDEGLAQLEDHFASLRIYIRASQKHGATLKSEVSAFIEDAHRDRGASAVRLSTVHGAKGLEAKRVFIIDPAGFDRMSRGSAEQIQGENCVQFVALTRSSGDLVFVEKLEETNKSLAPEDR